MDYRESQQVFERIEVTIAVEQGMLLADAIRREQNVDGLANRSAGLSQPPIVVRRLRRERDVDERDDFELEQLRFDHRRFAVVTEPLQHFGEDDGRQADPLAIQVPIEPPAFRVVDSVQEVDPD